MAIAAARRRRFRDLDLASRAAFLSFSSNAVLMVLKLAVGFAFGSIAVLGDGVDSAQDVFASAITFFSVRYALQPADRAHPYGHGKAESLAAMTQALLIAGAAIFVAVAAARRALAEEVEIILAPSLAIMGISALVNFSVAMYAMHASRVTGSVAVAADARHLLTNVVQAFAVIGALVLVGVTGNHIFDPIVALGLAAYLVWIAATIARSAVAELIDTALPPESIELVEQCLAHETHGLRGYHRLRTRKSGRQRHIDLHVLLDPALTVREAHVLVDDLERDIQRCIPGAVVTIHVDPDDPDMRHAHEDEPPEADDDRPHMHMHRH
jgi:cation diffusion facilitator family transporter